MGDIIQVCKVHAFVLFGEYLTTVKGIDLVVDLLANVGVLSVKIKLETTSCVNIDQVTSIKFLKEQFVLLKENHISNLIWWKHTIPHWTIQLELVSIARKFKIRISYFRYFFDLVFSFIYNLRPLNFQCSNPMPTKLILISNTLITLGENPWIVLENITKWSLSSWPNLPSSNIGYR